MPTLVHRSKSQGSGPPSSLSSRAASFTSHEAAMYPFIRTTSGYIARLGRAKRETIPVNTVTAKDISEENSPLTPLVSPEELEALHFDVSYLALDKPSRFLQPLPLSKINAWLDDARPWDMRRLGTDLAKVCRIPAMMAGNTAYQNADELAHSFSGFLFGYPTTSALNEVESILRRANYKRRMKQPWMMNQRGFWYRVQDVFELDSPATCPPISCTLVNGMELPEGRLSVNELYVVANMTTLRFLDGFFRTATHIPVTIISFGGNKARVLHGYFDGDTQRVALSMSRTMEFTKEGCFATDDWKYLMCWALAEPITK